MYAVKEVEVTTEGWNIKMHNFGESNPYTRKCDRHPLCQAPHRPRSPVPPACLFSTDDEYSIRLIHVAKEVVWLPEKTQQGKSYSYNHCPKFATPAINLPHATHHSTSHFLPI